MRHPRLYLDEDVRWCGRKRGYDVLTTAEAGRSGANDEDQLQFAISDERCVFSFNRGDFAQLHTALVGGGEHHFGIILSKQVPVGVTVRRLSEWLGRTEADEVRDHLVWLSV